MSLVHSKGLQHSCKGKAPKTTFCATYIKRSRKSEDFRPFFWSRWQDLNLRPFGPEIRTDVFLCHIMPAVVIRRKASLLTSSDMDENIPLQFSCNRCRTRLFPFARVIYRLAKPSSPLSDKTIIPHTLWYFNIWTDKASPISAIHENELGHPASKMLVGSPSFGALAQLVARYIRIVEVTGSNPVCSTIKGLKLWYKVSVLFFIFLQNPNAKRQMHPGIWIIPAFFLRRHCRSNNLPENRLDKMHPLPSVGA